MTQLKHLEDIHTHPACRSIRSLQEVVTRARLQVKPKYKRWEEIEAHLINGGVAPSLSAYLLYEYQFNKESLRELSRKLGKSKGALKGLVKKLNIPTRSLAEANKLDEISIPKKKIIERLYNEEGKTDYEIADMFETSQATVRKWRRIHSIKARDGSNSHLPKGVKKPSKEELRKEYEENSSFRIAKNRGVHISTILNWLDSYEIERKTMSEIKLPENASKPSKEELKEMYVENNMSDRVIAKICSVNQTTIGRWRREYDIKTKDASSCWANRPSGKNHWNWNGGTSFEPYSLEFEKILAPYIRERDDYACQVCGEQEDGKTLSVHHIDYNKENNSESNLVTLCTSCHGHTSVVNDLRTEWTEMFQEIIQEKYEQMSWDIYAQLQDYKVELKQIKTEFIESI